MGNETVTSPAPAQTGKTVTRPAAGSASLPEAFRPAPEPATPEPELDAFLELEQIDAKNPADYSRPPKKGAESAKPAPAKPAAAKPDGKEPQKPATDSKKHAQDKPEAEKGEKPAADAEKPLGDEKALPQDDPSRRFQMASELRKDYRRIHEENQRLATELKDLRAGKPQLTEEQKVLSSKLETLEKRNKELEEEISYRDFTKSNEFAEKFRKPFETKLARVYRQVADLYVRTEDGSERPASREDFDRVLEAPQADARRIAKEIFGDEDFREVLQYRRELNELQQNADEEMRNWREKAKERETMRASEERKMREQAEVTFKKAIDTYTEKYPEWFGEVEGDEEMNKALQAGFATVDRSQDRNLPLEERLDLLAAARLKAASFGRHVIQIKRLKSRISELEEKIKGFEASAPGEGTGQRAATIGGGSGDDIPDANSEIDELERRNPVAR